MTTSISIVSSRWSLARVLILILAGAFLGLMLDIRVEHVDVVRETGYAWIPIIYSAVMAIACLLAAVAWNCTARLLMRILFLLAFVVGGMGFYLHNHGNFARVLSTSAHAWTDPKMKHPHGPPQTAPLAFAGLGLIGATATFKRFS